MAVQKNLYKRIVKFVALLKQNRYPNCNSFVRLLKEEYRREYDFNAQSGNNHDNKPIPFLHQDLQTIKEPFKSSKTPSIDKGNICSRTIFRDIEFLKNDLEAPIDFDSKNNGYYLIDPDWCLEDSLGFANEDISSLVIGSNMLTSILPTGSLFKDKLMEIQENLIAENRCRSEFSAIPSSFYVGTEPSFKVETDVLDEMFLAWKTCTIVTMTYVNSNSIVTESKFEPHILGYDKGIWFVKGKIMGNACGEIVRIDLHHISEALKGETSFVQDLALIDEMYGTSNRAA